MFEERGCDRVVVSMHPKFFSSKYSWVKLVYTYACVAVFKHRKKGFKVELTSYDRVSEPRAIAFNPVEADLLEYLSRVVGELEVVDSPMFLFTEKELQEYQSKPKIVHGFHKNFYKWSIRKLKLPIDRNYDDVNKVPIPRRDVESVVSDATATRLCFPPKGSRKYIRLAEEWVGTHFPSVR